MSRGAGHVMRAIEAAIELNPSRPLTTDCVCRRAYPTVETIEKKHRVAAVRAMRSFVRRREGMAIQIGRQLNLPGPGFLILFDENNRDIAVAHLRERAIWFDGDWPTFYAIKGLSPELR